MDWSASLGNKTHTVSGAHRLLPSKVKRLFAAASHQKYSPNTNPTSKSIGCPLLHFRINNNHHSFTILFNNHDQICLQKDRIIHRINFIKLLNEQSHVTASIVSQSDRSGKERRFTFVATDNRFPLSPTLCL